MTSAPSVSDGRQCGGTSNRLAGTVLAWEPANCNRNLFGPSQRPSDFRDDDDDDDSALRPVCRPASTEMTNDDDGASLSVSAIWSGYAGSPCRASTTEGTGGTLSPARPLLAQTAIGPLQVLPLLAQTTFGPGAR